MTNITNKQPGDESGEGHPNEEEFFDYFLGRADPVTSRRISAYLAAHPERAAELKDWALLENRVAGFPVREPKAQILENVRRMARSHLPVESPWSRFVVNLRAVLRPRTLALCATFTIVAGLSLIFKPHLPTGAENQMAGLSRSSDGIVAAPTQMAEFTRSPDGVTSVSGQMAALTRSADGITSISATSLSAPTEHKGAVAMPLADAVSETLADYSAATEVYRQGNYLAASDAFSKIMAAEPAFPKRRELYTLWVESLKKLGKFDLAEKKQAVLEEIIRSEGTKP